MARVFTVFFTGSCGTAALWFDISVSDINAINFEVKKR
jgi:hypothetical protein